MVWAGEEESQTHRRLRRSPRLHREEEGEQSVMSSASAKKRGAGDQRTSSSKRSKNTPSFNPEALKITGHVPFFQISGLQTEPLTHPGDCWWYVEVQTKGKEKDLMFFWKSKQSNVDGYNKGGVVLSVSAPDNKHIKLIVEDVAKGRYFFTKDLDVSNYAFNNMSKAKAKAARPPPINCQNLGFKDLETSRTEGSLTSLELAHEISSVREKLWLQGTFCSKVLQELKHSDVRADKTGSSAAHDLAETSNPSPPSKSAGGEEEDESDDEEAEESLTLDPDEQLKKMQKGEQTMERLSKYYPLGFGRTVKIKIWNLKLCTGNAVLFNHREYNPEHMLEILALLIKHPNEKPTPAVVIPYDKDTGELYQWADEEDLRKASLRFWVVDGQHSVKAQQVLQKEPGVRESLRLHNKFRECIVLSADTPPVELANISHSRNTVAAVASYTSPYPDQIVHARGMWKALGEPARPRGNRAPSEKWKEFERLCRFVLLEQNQGDAAEDEEGKSTRRSRKGKECLSDQYDLILSSEEVWQKWNQIWKEWREGNLKDSNGELPAKPDQKLFDRVFMKRIMGLTDPETLDLQDKLLDGTILLRKSRSSKFQDAKDYANHLKRQRALHEGISEFCCLAAGEAARDFSYWLDKLQLTCDDMKELTKICIPYVTSRLKRNVKTEAFPERAQIFLKRKLGFGNLQLDGESSTPPFVVTHGCKGIYASQVDPAPVSLFVLNIIEDQSTFYDKEDLDQWSRTCIEMTNLDTFSFVIFCMPGKQTAAVSEWAEDITLSKKILWSIYDMESQCKMGLPKSPSFANIVLVLASKLSTISWDEWWTSEGCYVDRFTCANDNLDHWKKGRFMDDAPIWDKFSTDGLTGPMQRIPIRPRCIKYFVHSLVEDGQIVCEWYMNGLFAQCAIMGGMKPISIVRDSKLVAPLTLFFESVIDHYKNKKKEQLVLEDHVSEPSARSHDSQGNLMGMGDEEADKFLKNIVARSLRADSVNRSSSSHGSLCIHGINKGGNEDEAHSSARSHVKDSLLVDSDKEKGPLVGGDSETQDENQNKRKDGIKVPTLDPSIHVFSGTGNNWDSEPTKKLVIFDINGVLAAVFNEGDDPIHLHTKQKAIKLHRKLVYFRPFAKEIIKWCLECGFDVAIWSSMAKSNVHAILNALGISTLLYKFVWHKDQVEEVKDLPYLATGGKYISVKRLSKVYEEFQEYNKHNTVLIDDSPYKSYHNSDNLLVAKTYSPVDYETDKWFNFNLVPCLAVIRYSINVVEALEEYPELKEVDEFSSKVMRAMDRIIHGA